MEHSVRRTVCYNHWQRKTILLKTDQLGEDKEQKIPSEGGSKWSSGHFSGQARAVRKKSFQQRRPSPPGQKKHGVSCSWPENQWK